ncbi:MAG: hypothetical protein WBX01_14430 [Nitrososphaeraceae archaeon]
MIGFSNPLLFSIKLSSSHKWVSIFFLVLLFGFSAIVFSGHVDLQGSAGCDRQTFSLADCRGTSSRDGGSNNNDDNDDRQNIEGQIPSVIPFP